ncbi:MAG TPA: transporter substrate-binding domain-containing protein [Nonomuraea sp.]|uniref:transporter substrate-binding domain-containing protein n=1 Tax=Nonomuraea sp. NPDC049649 TaxID=3155776 RepID=UPI002CBB82F1|nr:transporter substrate-binding domain-containing protein [Nonomuraea sp.]
MKRLMTVILAVVALTAAGCGTGAPPSLLDKDEIVIGVRPDLPQVGYLNGEEFEGFDVDVAAYVADRLGKKYRLISVLASDREDVLLSGEADLVVASYTISEDRKQKVLFAGPYHISYQDILIRRDEERIRNVRDLAGRRICEVEGANAAQRVVEERRVRAEIKSFPDYQACLRALKENEIDAITTDDIILAGLARQDGGGLRLANAGFNEQRSGIGMRHGDVAACEEVNRAITDMYQDGTAGKLLSKWFRGTGLETGRVAVPQFEGCS